VHGPVADLQDEEHAVSLWWSSLWWPADTREGKVDRTGVPTRAGDVSPEHTIDRADVGMREPAVSGDELASKGDHVVHAAQHAAVGCGGDAQCFVAEPAEGICRQVLGGQLPLDKAHNERIK
jgi:hypothetical protein